MKKLLSIALLASLSFSPVHLFAQKYHDAMALYGVKGNVKEILIEYQSSAGDEWRKSYHTFFNKDGSYETGYFHGLSSSINIERDERGRLKKAIITSAISEVPKTTILYKYNSSDQLIATEDKNEDDIQYTEYVLNSNGVPIKEIWKTETGGKVGKSITTVYSDYKYDNRGNWTFRTTKGSYGDRKWDSKERRSITYWDNKVSSSSTYSPGAGGTYTIQKGDVLWNVSKQLLKESGKANPTNGEIMQAMEDIAKANDCETPDECRTKFFYDRHVGKTIKIPSYLARTGTKTQSSSSSTVTNKPSSSSTTTPSTSSSSTYSSGSTYGNTSSHPSYNYSYKKYREPHKWVGFSIGYVQKSWASKIDGKKERYGMWEDSKFVNGVQAGIRVEPVTSFGLGLNTGLFYEYYYTESDDMYYTNGPGSYRGVIQEHALYLPVHLEYRLRFSDDFSAFIYGGAGFDYGISAGVEFKDTDDDYVVYENNSLYESEDVENWKRFNASLEYGLGLSYKNVQLNVTRSHGLVNMAKEDGYSVKQNKPLMVSLSIMF